MILRRDDTLRGADDFVGELALARRARRRYLANAPAPLCGRRFTHPRWPIQLDTRVPPDRYLCMPPAERSAWTRTDVSTTRRARLEAGRDERPVRLKGGTARQGI